MAPCTGSGADGSNGIDDDQLAIAINDLKQIKSPQSAIFNNIETGEILQLLF